MDNRYVLITGGSSDIATPLISSILKKTNYKIIISSFNNQKSYENERIYEIRADLSSENGIYDFLEKLNPFHISFYLQLQGNAVSNDTLIEQEYCDMLFSLNINVLSTNMILSKLLPKMKEDGYGRIVLTSTASSEFGGGMKSFSYGLSKHSVSYTVKHLAKYYSEFGIITNGVSPGFIKTKFHTKVLNRKSDFLEKRGKTVKVGYCGLPNDVSNLMFNLAFENNFICGEMIKIDGADFI